MNKTIAYLLIIIGFLGSAFYASTHPTEMNWVPFIAFLLVGIVGLFILKATESAESKHPEVLKANKAHIHESLNNILGNIKQLNNNKESIPTFEMRFEIDKKFREDLDRFANARTTMIHIYSLQDYADIMSAFASGERYLNRVWSASTDGYMDEVISYVEKAARQFQDAKDILDKVSEKYAVTSTP